jgi:AhpD family alkylhydroperoxidase
MSDFPLHTITTAPEQARPILEQLQERVGFVPNLAAMMADSPLVLEAYVTLGAIFGRGSFSPVEQQLILMTAGFGNHCSYCMAAHSTFAKALGASDAVREAIRAGKLPDDLRLAALVAFTLEVVRHRGQLSAEALRDFREAGFTPAQALDVLIGVSQGTLASLVHNLAATPLDEGFQPQQWSIPF